MRSVMVIALLAFGVGACDSLGVPVVVEVRVQNASSVSLDRVSFWAGSQEVSYSTLEPGQHTPYVAAENAYGFTTVEVLVQGEIARLQVTDYVGETPLSSGRYTYVIGLAGVPGQRSLTQQLRRDP